MFQQAAQNIYDRYEEITEDEEEFEGELDQGDGNTRAMFVGIVQAEGENVPQLSVA